jgi:hypothetical protein
MAPHMPPTAACDGRSQFLRSWEFLMPALPAFFIVRSLPSDLVPASPLREITARLSGFDTNLKPTRRIACHVVCI